MSDYILASDLHKDFYQHDWTAFYKSEIAMSMACYNIFGGDHYLKDAFKNSRLLVDELAHNIKKKHCLWT